MPDKKYVEVADVSTAEGMVVDELTAFLKVMPGETIVFNRMAGYFWYQYILWDRKVVIEFYPWGYVSLHSIAADDLDEALENMKRLVSLKRKLQPFHSALQLAWEQRPEKTGISITIVRNFDDQI